MRDTETWLKYRWIGTWLAASCALALFQYPAFISTRHSRPNNYISLHYVTVEICGTSNTKMSYDKIVLHSKCAVKQVNVNNVCSLYKCQRWYAASNVIHLKQQNHKSLKRWYYVPSHSHRLKVSVLPDVRSVVWNVELWTCVEIVLSSLDWRWNTLKTTPAHQSTSTYVLGIEENILRYTYLLKRNPSPVCECINQSINQTINDVNGWLPLYPYLDFLNVTSNYLWN